MAADRTETALSVAESHGALAVEREIGFDVAAAVRGKSGEVGGG